MVSRETSIITALRQVPVWGWIVLAGIVGAGVLAYHHYAITSRDETTSWLDPQQPATQIGVDPVQPDTTRAKNRVYAPSLDESSHTWVGRNLSCG